MTEMTITQIEALLESASPNESEWIAAHAMQLATQLLATMRENARLRGVLRECQVYIIECGPATEAWEKELLESIVQAFQSHPADGEL